MNLQKIAGKLRKVRIGTDRWIWSYEAETWIPIHSDLLAEIRRQDDIAIGRRYQRDRYFDPLTFKTNGEILWQHRQRQSRAIGEPAPILNLL